MKYLLFLAFALYALIRTLAAFPVMFLEIGAWVAGDKESAARFDRWIDKIIGEKTLGLD